MIDIKHEVKFVITIMITEYHEVADFNIKQIMLSL